MSKRPYRKAYHAAYYQQNKIRLNAQAKIRHQTEHDKEIMASYSLKKHYGITLEGKKKMYEEQQGLCKLCGKPLPTNFRQAHVDHDHETNKIRGLIHSKCNHFLGHLEKNPDLIDKALQYLRSMKPNEAL